MSTYLKVINEANTCEMKYILSVYFQTYTLSYSPTLVWKIEGQV